MSKLTTLCVLVIFRTVLGNSELDLWNAAKNGDLGYVQHAITTGANLNYKYQDYYGRTLLHVASEKNRQDIVNRLLTAGAYVNQLDNFGNTPIYLASAAGLAYMVILLNDHEGDVDIQNTGTGWSPLMAATANGYSGTVTALINKAHASIDLQDKQGYTALHHASETNKRDVVLLLLQKGAANSIKDKKGRTSAELARETHLEDLANIIESYNNPNIARETPTTPSPIGNKTTRITTTRITTKRITTAQQITASLTVTTEPPTTEAYTTNTYTFIILGVTIAILLLVLISTGVVLGIKKRKNEDQQEFTTTVLW